ncbi:MAG: class II D-tagatose-bisphosphate aldolase, non-catalytic subunit [Bacteroidales bacterium]|nr:class II D-tagatose-bisphosphate aldolase, non-catalytic subunit [Bacteroidales bacterium]
MNETLRIKARQAGLSLLDYLLMRMDQLEEESGVKRTIFAACPNSTAVLRASLVSAKRCNAPIKFAATLNQVDTDGGYTGFTAEQFVKTIRDEARRINYTGPVIVAIDHGGPWLKDKHRLDNLSYDETMAAVKNSFERAIDAGYDMIHVDPTIDITLPEGETIDIRVVAAKTVELISHCENYRKNKGLDKLAYEVGTEEVHGGLADMSVFTQFLELLKTGLEMEGLNDIWPCFVVGKVGTDLHTTLFDPQVARQLTAAARPYGSRIKGHYSDSVDNPEEYPLSGMGAANIGPEFTEREYDGLMELVELEENLYAEGKVAKLSGMKERLWEAVIDSNRWVKWISGSESASDFYSIAEDRQEWLIKTGCRYIWENTEVIAARQKLFHNLDAWGIQSEEIVLSGINRAMDRYFHSFNLVNLTQQL